MAEKDEPHEAVTAMELDESSKFHDVQRFKLRQRWELASVLNFLSVFEPVIGNDLKMSAEEIETALITPNASLAKLHVTLLKGIPPVSKNLSSPDVWVTVLCKKLAEWWPWVAEGDVPLTAAKGEEISRYKELDPTIRLLMLNALCEVRVEQDDLVSYINDALKEGTELSRFRKDKIAEDGTGISYWYDGNSVIGHRLYREVKKSQFKSKYKGKGNSYLPPTNIEWETLATNLDEFRTVLEQLSSCKVGVESVVYFIETEVIPVLEQQQKKRERALKRQQRQEALLNGYPTYAVGVTRSCRARKPVSYTFDEFDRTIDEALKLTKKRKDQTVLRYDRKQQERGKRVNVSEGSSEKDANSNEGSLASMDEDVEDEQQGKGSDSDEDDATYSENVGKNEDGETDDNENSGFDLESDKPGSVKLLSEGEKNSSRTTFGHHLQESRNLGAKNRLRQRPTRNTALDSSVVPDSDSGSSSEDASVGTGDPSVVADSEDKIGS